ncbi:MAG: helix-turn-helix domain-containing protein [Anaerobutyricum sp.]
MDIENSIGLRMKKIRDDADINQEAMGDKLLISKSSISKIEKGINNPSDQTIKLVCSEFNVNEEWLRHGIGEPYIENTHNDLTTKAAALLGRRDPMFEAIVEAYCDLDDNDREVLLKSLQNLVSIYNDKKKE